MAGTSARRVKKGTKRRREMQSREETRVPRVPRVPRESKRHRETSASNSRRPSAGVPPADVLFLAAICRYLAGDRPVKKEDQIERDCVTSTLAINRWCSWRVSTLCTYACISARHTQTTARPGLLITKTLAVSAATSRPLSRKRRNQV